LIERAVILSEKGVLANPFSTLDANLLGEDPTNGNFIVLRSAQESSSWDSQRSVIVRALDASGWIVGGLRGAAVRLGLKRTTLISKMRKLGISRPVRQLDIGRLTENRESEQWWQPTVE